MSISCEVMCVLMSCDQCCLSCVFTSAQGPQRFLRSVAMPPFRSTTMPPWGQRASRPYRAIDDTALDIAQLLPEGGARDASRMSKREVHAAQEQGVRQNRRKHARSPSTPRPRSASVDSEADIVCSERAEVIQQARRISKHWDSGAPGRASRQRAEPLGPIDFSALVEQRRCAAADAALRTQATSQRSPSDIADVSEIKHEAMLMPEVHDAVPQTPRDVVLGQLERSCAVGALPMSQDSQKISPSQSVAQHHVADGQVAVIAHAAACDCDHWSPEGFSPLSDRAKYASGPCASTRAQNN